MKTVQAVPVPEPQAFISTAAPPEPEDTGDGDVSLSLIKLQAFADASGDISDMLDEGEVTRIGEDTVREWEMDSGSRADWLEEAETFLTIAAQETDDEEGEKNYPFENAADIHYPVLTVSSQQFVARASPELIRGDKAVGVKVFEPPVNKPGPIQLAKAAPQPTDNIEAAADTAQVQQEQQQQAMQDAAMSARRARGQRVSHYLNWLIFYRMDNWENDSEALIQEMSITGAGFKKIYYGASHLESDFVSAMRLTVHMDTTSIWRCPRITQDFDAYPYEITAKQRSGVYRNIDLPDVGEDPENPRKLIEQHRLDDLDGDGLPEPYIVTCDVETRQVLRIEAAYTADDIVIDPTSERVLRIERWLPFAYFPFLLDPKGRFYGIGFGKLLASIMDSVDTSINQLIDAGSAQIAGGGFMGSGVRLQGSGQGGDLFFRPGEYQVVGVAGNDLRSAIWERTVPQPSTVTFSLLEMLLSAAKDIASIKDVITGDAPSTAPVGTTLALQNQALQVFSSIYKRIYRGFRDEFQLMFKALKRWATDEDRKQYAELTGGNFDEDFSGDGTDIQPVSDPTVVSKMQKLARVQTLMQLAESPVGMAAGMTQSGPAQEIMRDALDIMDYDRPERFFAPVAPNPLEVAKAQDLAATAQLKQADAAIRGVQGQKAQASATLDHAKALREVGETAKTSHEMHQLGDQMMRDGQVAPLAEEAGEKETA